MSERGVTYGIESRGLVIVSILRPGTKFGHDGRYKYGTVGIVMSVEEMLTVDVSSSP
jgi:hypothetical protein